MEYIEISTTTDQGINYLLKKLAIDYLDQQEKAKKQEIILQNSKFKKKF